MTSQSTTTFSLADRGLKLDTEEDTKSHTSDLASSTSHTTILLNGNTFGPSACTHLSPLLTRQTNLHTINLADIFTSRLLSEIPPALSSLLTSLLPLQKLQTVDLSDNAFGLNTQAPLVEFLKAHVPLRVLILNNNGLGPEAGANIANALSALADRKAEARKTGKEGIPGLETVICGRNRLETGSMRAWASAFRKHADDVKVVKMVQNGIRQPGIEHLLREGLRGCEKLEVLDLQDNTFTHVGARALADVVTGWPHLRELGVGDSLLGARGMGMLCDALNKGGNTQLRTLRCQYDEIDAKGVGKLWGVVKAGKLPALRRVEVNGNKFSEDDEGIEGLRVELEKRREEAGEGEGEGEEGEWGIDKLDELESDDDEDEDEDEGSEKEEEDEEAVERETKAVEILRDAEEEEGRNVSQKKDEDVDALAEKLGKTEMV
ncbi:MAG: hypothetical protein LQ350_004257 [Teloschistes chrysophthalmus]|nr:MAG: hypothetical protein LQ350_004257 [Niorma chrysophthalma]